jgi:hypothetical protein
MGKALRLCLASALGICSCVSEIPTKHLSCPCADGWYCCYGQNLCVRKGVACPCEGLECNPQSTPVSGGLWVTPNPVLFMPGAAGHRGVSINNVGSERIVVEDIVLKGDEEFSFANEGPTRLPWDLPGSADCERGAAIEGFYLDYQPTDTEKPAGSLVVHTDDPTSPTITVAIGLEQTGLLDLGSPGWAEAVTYVVVSPNPIRFDPLPPGEREVLDLAFCPNPPPYTEGEPIEQEPIHLTCIRVIGKDFYIMRLFDSEGGFVQFPIEGEYEFFGEHQIQLAYEPLLEQSQDGVLEVEFLDRRGIAQLFRVPILVQ